MSDMYAGHVRGINIQRTNASSTTGGLRMLNCNIRRWLGRTLVVITLLMLSDPLWAAPQADTLENREAIAQQYVKIEMASLDDQLDMALPAFAMAVAQLKSQEEIDNFVNTVKPRIRRDKLERAAINALTDIYTVPELQHMMRCLSTEEGMSIKKKMFRFQGVVMMALQREIEFARRERR